MAGKCYFHPQSHSFMLRQLLGLYVLLFCTSTWSQSLQALNWDNRGQLSVVNLSGQNFNLQGRSIPLFTFEWNGTLVSSNTCKTIGQNQWQYASVTISIDSILMDAQSWQATMVFTHTGQDTAILENVVFLGADARRHYITGEGNHWLSRTRLFRPGLSSVPVILPDNAWELGYSDCPLRQDTAICALVRRFGWSSAQRRRFETHLFPHGQVNYKIHVEAYTGTWQVGLRLMFQQRWLYDLPAFNDQLYHRQDQKWIKDAAMMHLVMCWDQDFYDRKTADYTIQNFIRRGKQLYGGDEVLGFWPTWPALGMDQRNQWDMYRTLPGGLKALKKVVQQAHQEGAKIMIAYNPWDESTRREDHLTGMQHLIKATDVDGVILDTWGKSSAEMQAAADAAKPGMVLYSEGMAIPRDMPGIISGRVHNALYYPPILNLNKFIRPDFAIFRVTELKYEPIRREYNLSLFNGHGIEMNIFSPGRPDWAEADYRYLGAVLRPLREHNKVFKKDYTPLVYTLHDGILANRWGGEQKTIYTLYSTLPQGYYDRLLSADFGPEYHSVDLWHHEELVPDTVGRFTYLKVKMDAFNPWDQGTNNEGAVNVIGVFKNHLRVEHNDLTLTLGSAVGDTIKLWAGTPDYQKSPVVFRARVDHEVNLWQLFPGHEGKIIVQLFEGKELMDERVISLKPGAPHLINGSASAKTVSKDPTMVAIPSGIFHFITTHGDEFIPYPQPADHGLLTMPSFYMDRHPVSNNQYYRFLQATKYVPTDTARFLAHWVKGKYKPGEENHPVIFVSRGDAEAYARWAGKRLPTEAEWQYAAQAGQEQDWPWGAVFDSTRCSRGDQHYYPANGLYPQGQNAWGLQDLVGQVWQMTSENYAAGTYSYTLLKGGSYFKPTASWWYVQGGPHKLSHRQIWLQVSPGFERQATVGFRCVADAFQQ